MERSGHANHPSAVFLDRDGVINQRAGDDAYVASWAEFEFLPGAVEAMAALSATGATLFVVTNQRGVARGLVRVEDLRDIHERLAVALSAANVRLGGIYTCPHEIGQCDCRKPGVGLFKQARDENPWIDFGRSQMVGDSLSDAQAAAKLDMPIWIVGGESARVAKEASAKGISVAGTASSLAELVGAGLLLEAIKAGDSETAGSI